MNKKQIAASVALAVVSVFALTACAPSSATSGPTAAESATPKPPKHLTLKVPQAITGSNATIIVNGGPLSQGTEVTVYRFGGGWSSPDGTCSDPNAESRKVQVIGGGVDQPVNFPVTEGVYSWVATADGQSTPCGDPQALTTVLVDPTVKVFTDSKTITKVGQSRQVEFQGDALPANEKAKATVELQGPWPSVPTAASAKCESAPVADTKEIEMFDDPNKVTDSYKTEFTPTKAGVYRVVLRLDKTTQSVAFDSCATDDAANLFSVGK